MSTQSHAVEQWAAEVGRTHDHAGQQLAQDKTRLQHSLHQQSFEDQTLAICLQPGVLVHLSAAQNGCEPSQTLETLMTPDPCASPSGRDRPSGGRLQVKSNQTVCPVSLWLNHIMAQAFAVCVCVRAG